MKILIIAFLILNFSVVAEAQVTYRYPKSKALKIDEDILAYCFSRVLNQYPNGNLAPAETYPVTQGWNHLDYCYFKPGMFRDYLSADPNRNCDYQTEREPQLRQWILAQNDNSIDPVKLFAKSMELNQGKMFDALLTIHQLLRNEGRYWSTDYYMYSSDARSEEKFWNKFIDIRGNLRERGGSFQGDHVGSWYRIWGIMMWRMQKTNKAHDHQDDCDHDFQARFFSRELADLQTDMTAIAAEAIKPLLQLLTPYTPGPDKLGKLRVNLAGSGVAARIDDYANGKQFNQSWNEQVNCAQTPYLKEK